MNAGQVGRVSAIEDWWVGLEGILTSLSLIYIPSFYISSPFPSHDDFAEHDLNSLFTLNSRAKQPNQNQSPPLKKKRGSCFVAPSQGVVYLAFHPAHTVTQTRTRTHAHKRARTHTFTHIRTNAHVRMRAHSNRDKHVSAPVTISYRKAFGFVKTLSQRRH